MFPWSPEFVWDATHVLFFGALYGVLATVAFALGLATWRAARDAREGRTAAVAWHAAFEDLPLAARSCRHALSGEAPGRVCENAFDCRRCREHAGFAARHAARPDAGDPPTGDLGFALPLDRLYHRGHTWVRLEADGRLRVGLDDLARRLVGTPDELVLPEPGTRLEVNGEALTLRRLGSVARLLSPVDGRVISSEGRGAGVTLLVDPEGPVELGHLLSGNEAKAWALRELERLQGAFGPRGAAALADGGELVEDVAAVLPRDSYDTLLGDLLLEP